MKNSNRKSKKSTKYIISLLTISIIFLLYIPINRASANSYIHISIDDTINVFQDLTNNQDVYNSIFDNDMLAFFHFLHTCFDAKFSLYCYYESPDFSLSECTSKYKQEFINSSDWLKFGFHSINTNSNLANSDYHNAKNNYEKTISELIRIAGEQSIDTVIRLHNYAGNESAIQGLVNSSYGITGLLTADDSRNSYNLSTEENNYIQSNDILSTNGINYITTDLRLENSTIPYFDLRNIHKNINQNSAIEVFTHEWQLGLKMKAKLLLTCVFSYKYGYEWNYYANIAK